MPSYGFGNHHQTEAIKDTLPKTQNSPQSLPNDLFAEQISGSAFTRERKHNLHGWVYRQQPSVVHEDYQPYDLALIQPLSQCLAPNPYRWFPFPTNKNAHSFLEGLLHIAQTSDANLFIYQCKQSMEQQYFNDMDGELLFIPYQGTLALHTEFGILTLGPGQIAVIPRGVFFKVIVSEPAAGYLCENKGLPFSLPELGFLGANALANPRHFTYPDAAFEQQRDPVQLICKAQDQCFTAVSPHSPLNVVAWHGNLAPYTYDLSLFNTLNTVSFDHPDPCIFSVLTAPSPTAGVATLDFVLFPPRWLVAQHSFRPPYFHRNIMSELMGLILGKYDAKQTGFEPGGISIHNAYVPHGPDQQTYAQALSDPLTPTYLENTLAFMLESNSIWKITELAMEHTCRQKNYTDCWKLF